MPNAKNQTITKRNQNGLLIGPPKTGKTNFLGTWPGLYVFDFDDGICTLYGKNVYYHVYKDTTPGMATGFKKAEDRLKAAMRCAKINGKVLFDEEKDEFFVGKYEGETIKAPVVWIKTIAVDGATEALRMAMSHAMGSRSGGELDRIPSENDWYPQMETFTRFIEKALVLPTHFWLTCHDKIKEIKKGDVNLGVRILPALTGQMATQFGGKFDIILRAKADKVGNKQEYKLQAAIQGIYEAGHRYGDAFGLYIQPASYKEVMKNLDEYQKRKGEILEKLRAERVEKIQKAQAVLEAKEAKKASA